jgi:hypothetical protein
MTREQLIAEIQRLDPAFEDIDLSSHKMWELENLLDYIENDTIVQELEAIFNVEE